MKNLWRDKDAGNSVTDQLVYLSNLIGRDALLVQPGGGNTSVKLREVDMFGSECTALVVKGSGTDLRTIGASGFTHLYMERLALLQRQRSITDERMMQFMRAAMLYPDRDPVPSVETPLHSLLPHRFIAHTHDVATLSLTDTPHAREHVSRVFGREVTFLEYARPGFPLARLLAERFADGPPQGSIALVMEKHGLTVWGETAKECYANLRTVINRAESYVQERRAGRQALGARGVFTLKPSQRQALAMDVLPVIRGEIATLGWRPVLHVDDSRQTLDAVGRRRFSQVASRGVMTPEHVLRAGRRPLVLRIDFKQKSERRKNRIRWSMRAHREDCRTTAKTLDHAELLPDYLKVVAIPGFGVVSAGKDKRSALVGADCYRATLRTMERAESVEKFEFLSDADATEMEYWPLERRKVDDGAKSRRPLDGRIAVIIGAASGIGRATAMRFAEEGAHLLLADVDADGVQRAATEISHRFPERAAAVVADVSDERSVEGIFREAVLRFGGLDVLFYSPGVGPRYHTVDDMPRDEVEQKLSVHFLGAAWATKYASRIMIDQGLGGRLIYNASKAAFAPGEGFAAYGASKAALVHYVRNAANELGRYGITANYVNADAIDTPMFRKLVRLRARRSGRTVAETLRFYEQRSVLRTATVPPDAVADAVLFLASDASAYTTGDVITVGGGHEAFPR